MAYLDIIDPSHPASIITMLNGKITPRDNRPLSPVPLKDKREKFDNYIELNYAPSTIQNFKWCADMIQAAGPRGFYTYNKLYQKYTTRKNIRSYVLSIMMYDFYDILPSGGRLELKTTYYKLSKPFQDFIDDLLYCQITKKLSPTTINVQVGETARFLKYVEDCGIKDIHDVTEKVIREYSIYGSCDNRTMHRVGKTIELSAEIHSDEKLLSISRLFPPAINIKHIYNPLIKEEREKIEAFLTDPSSDISKRNRAIGCLLYFTGMRAGDIRDLKKSSIDLVNKEIHFVQNKTQVHVRIPMRPVVSNAIVDYVKNERPVNDCPYLFISNNRKKVGTVTKCNIYSVADEIYKKTGTRNMKNARKGTHVLRHALADKLINEGADLSVISRILGHTTPGTTLGYINANIEQMRACALPISSFPIKSKLYE